MNPGQSGAPDCSSRTHAIGNATDDEDERRELVVAICFYGVRPFFSRLSHRDYGWRNSVSRFTRCLLRAARGDPQFYHQSSASCISAMTASMLLEILQQPMRTRSELPLLLEQLSNQFMFHICLQYLLAIAVAWMMSNDIKQNELLTTSLRFAFVASLHRCKRSLVNAEERGHFVVLTTLKFERAP